jgi:hypothetical protein
MFRPKFVIFTELRHIIELDMGAVLFLLNVRELVGAKQSIILTIYSGDFLNSEPPAPFYKQHLALYI